MSRIEVKEKDDRASKRIDRPIFRLIGDRSFLASILTPAVKCGSSVALSVVKEGLVSDCMDNGHVFICRVRAGKRNFKEFSVLKEDGKTHTWVFNPGDIINTLKLYPNEEDNNVECLFDKAKIQIKIGRLRRVHSVESLDANSELSRLSNVDKIEGKLIKQSKGYGIGKIDRKRLIGYLDSLTKTATDINGVNMKIRKGRVILDAVFETPGDEMKVNLTRDLKGKMNISDERTIGFKTEFISKTLESFPTIENVRIWFSKPEFPIIFGGGSGKTFKQLKDMTAKNGKAFSFLMYMAPLIRDSEA